MSSLIGLEIEIDGKYRFIGKVGYAPKCDIPNLEGHKILYKEEPWKDCISHKLQAFGINADVWEYARDELQVEGIVCHCPDNNKTLLIGKDKMELAFPVDLGTDVQMRIKLNRIKIFEYKSPIRMGYTRNIVKVKRKEYDIPPDPEQGNLFD